MQIAAILLVLTSVCIGSEVSTAIRLQRDDIIVSANSTADSSGIGNGTLMKDIRSQCDSNSFGLVSSQERMGVYYIRGVCGGLYKDRSLTRCSFLDLGMCYMNDGGTIKPGKLGDFHSSCSSCSLHIIHDLSILACDCDKGPGNGWGTQPTTIQLDDLLVVKNGFISCYGYTNFECPAGNVPY
ncbi:uncharacterized protein GGS22DRAFT_138548 [Annulohypoxylon maeteangense]|uniref:uncharacterized protein n=1 Tax=Annulohypoxylon maeteangense TaxID=1927788 RepID=UPI002008E2AA|nr:uncharacterized protein GGS22DRAFT_138548 [Annulohypoxylon maeteangense]KAI0885084.1 hypothetical protein GGS22DRAFT_138548 [Annulohypoxylon maeteangense]